LEDVDVTVEIVAVKLVLDGGVSGECSKEKFLSGGRSCSQMQDGGERGRR
jgi:hypothetical protein